jgi:tRNA-dihydrouridine synthase C
MLGRGALANPELPRQVAAELGLTPPTYSNETIDWTAQLLRLIDHTPTTGSRLVHRMKQWLRMAATFGDFRRFDAVKRAGTVGEVFAILDSTSDGYFSPNAASRLTG